MPLKTPAFVRSIHRLVELEEHVGSLWHRLISRNTVRRHAQAAVTLDEVRRAVGVMFRALGGDAALKIEAAPAIQYRGPRSLMQRIAGTHRQQQLAWRNESSLYLPARIDIFEDRSLNRELYLWLAALAAGDRRQHHMQTDWINHSQWLSCQVLNRFAGLQQSYQRLLRAHLQDRPAADSLPAGQAGLETMIQQALARPGTVRSTDSISLSGAEMPYPVYLWLHPCPPSEAARPMRSDEWVEQQQGGQTHNARQNRRYQAARVDMPDGRNGLLLDRFENIFSWAEYVKVDRTTDEDDDLDSAEDTAGDLDLLNVARDSATTAKRIRFDLDLPSSDGDDLVLEKGILLPEWDYRKGSLIDDYCCIQEMVTDRATAIELPETLRRTARRLRNQFEALLPTRVWYHGQTQGSELDMQAYIDFIAEQKQGQAIAEQGLYQEFRGGSRDMACLLLADLSLSTDAWINDQSRVIDVIRDSLFLFAEALAATGDRFAMYGFSSRYRDHIRFHTLKTFAERYNAVSRGRINEIKPGFYTRLGAAVRHATTILGRQTASQQLLMILTDGKPNDLDLYDGRYGIEDTRMALIEARRKGLQVFCVTIDEKAETYLPYMFGQEHYVVIRKPADLPRQLPLLYARLTH